MALAGNEIFHFVQCLMCIISGLEGESSYPLAQRWSKEKHWRLITYIMEATSCKLALECRDLSDRYFTDIQF